MGFLESKELIELNDLVILYINFNTIYPVTVKETILSKKGVEVENIYQTKYGSIKAIDLVGKKYGTKVQLSRGYGYALHPTLWQRMLWGTLCNRWVSLHQEGLPALLMLRLVLYRILWAYGPITRLNIFKRYSQEYSTLTGKTIGVIIQIFKQIYHR